MSPRDLSLYQRVPVGRADELFGWDAERQWWAAYQAWEAYLVQCAVLWAGFARRAV